MVIGKLPLPIRDIHLIRGKGLYAPVIVRQIKVPVVTPAAAPAVLDDPGAVALRGFGKITG